MQPPTRSAARVAIHDPADPRIEAYRDIRERDLRGRHGLCVAEGTVVLASLLRSAWFEPVSALVLAGREPGVAHLLDALPPSAPAFVAERAVMDAVAGFPIHRGVLALARRRGAADPLAGSPRRVLVGIGLANHDNVGGLLRCAAAFGAPCLFDAGSADPLYRKAIRVSAGAAFTVPHAREGTASEVLDRVEAAGLTPIALSPRGAVDLREVDTSRPLALVVGAEGPGLPDAVLERCETARIAMAPGHDSLNVTVAAGIGLHALAPR